ncbi:MAG: hypothetical protein WC794_00220 [Candidatus Doudnabacteria bacterium]|jgi:hypothetical protein
MDQLNQTSENQLKQGIVLDGILNLIRALDKMLVFFSLRHSKQFWGIVYDSVSRQPLDPVIVKLMYVDGREVETRVTDMQGHYGFLARPGKFKIFAKKTNYSFPSKNIPGNKDGIFENLYHGEFFFLAGDNEVVAPNIPMDPVGEDWNQQEKKKTVNTYPYLLLLSKKLVAVLFWFGFIMVLISFYKTYPTVPYLVYGFMWAYIFLAILAAILPEPRLWGKLKIKNPNLKNADILLELRNQAFPEIGLDKTSVREDGKFLLRAKPGKCFMLATLLIDGKPAKVLAQKLIRVGDSGVISSSLTLT